MAEIKSTMEMVMERAAKMAAESTHDTSDEDNNKLGMRLAAEYLNNSEENLLARLQEHNQDQRPYIH